MFSSAARGARGRRSTAPIVLDVQCEDGRVVHQSVDGGERARRLRKHLVHPWSHPENGWFAFRARLFLS